MTSCYELYEPAERERERGGWGEEIAHARIRTRVHAYIAEPLGALRAASRPANDPMIIMLMRIVLMLMIMMRIVQYVLSLLSIYCNYIYERLPGRGPTRPLRARSRAASDGQGAGEVPPRCHPDATQTRTRQEATLKVMFMLFVCRIPLFGEQAMARARGRPGPLT